MINSIFKKAFNHILKPACVLCGQQGDHQISICQPCHDDLPIIKSGCHYCGHPILVQGICGQCQHQPPAFDTSIIPYHYQKPVDLFIQQFKYNAKLYYGELLSQLLIAHLKKNAVNLPQALIPMPLHPRRQRERGFNQALEITKSISRHLDIPIIKNAVIRSKNTLSQTTLSAKERKKNMRQVFELTDKTIQYHHVAIIDDVVTTGVTVNELAKTLKRANIDQIDIWACARATINAN